MGYYEKDELELDRIEILKQEISISIKALETARNDGFREAIELLRSIPHNHLSKWSHSRDLKFAPVELSDYLVIQYRKVNKES